MKAFVFPIRLCICLFALLSLLSVSYASPQWHLPNGAIARLGKGRLGRGSDKAIVFSPNGQRLAVASTVGVWIYDVTTSRELALLAGHMTHVESVSFAPRWDDSRFRS